MSDLIVFWIAVGFVVFVFILALQMRGMCCQALDIAGRAAFPDLEHQDYANAVKTSPNPASLELSGLPEELRAHLIEKYPQAIRHLKAARRVSRVAPFALLAVIVIARAKGII